MSRNSWQKSTHYSSNIICVSLLASVGVLVNEILIMVQTTLYTAISSLQLHHRIITLTRTFHVNWFIIVVHCIAFWFESNQIAYILWFIQVDSFFNVEFTHLNFYTHVNTLLFFKRVFSASNCNTPVDDSNRMKWTQFERRGKKHIFEQMIATDNHLHLFFSAADRCRSSM